jgi:hypothetical protein
VRLHVLWLRLLHTWCPRAYSQWPSVLRQPQRLDLARASSSAHTSSLHVLYTRVRRDLCTPPVTWVSSSRPHQQQLLPPSCE